MADREEVVQHSSVSSGANNDRPPLKDGGVAWVISVYFEEPDEAERAYKAIEKLLGDMGQIGTLSMSTKDEER